MALVLTRGVPGLDSLQPLAPEPNAPPPAPLSPPLGAQEQSFLDQYRPYAEKYSAQTGIPASVYLAMGASESNWGRAGSIFGIKADPTDPNAKMYDTWEAGPNGERTPTRAAFATYASPDEAFQHFHKVLSAPRYAGALDYVKNTGDAAGFMRQINDAGYATDPHWADSIMSIASRIGGDAPHQYDPNAAPIVSRVMTDPLSTHLSDGQTSGFPAPRMPFSPYQPAPDPWAPAAPIDTMLPDNQAQSDMYSPTPPRMGINPNQGGFRGPENPANLEPGPNADYGIFDYGNATSATHIPYSEQAADYLGGAVDASPAAAPFNIASMLANKVSKVAGGPDVAPTAGEVSKTFVPTNAVDATMLAAPFLGDAANATREGATALRGAAERAATEGLGAEAGRAPNAAATAGERLLARGNPGLEGGAFTPEERIARAKQMYQQAREQGMSDEEIAASFGQSAVDAGRGVDVAAQQDAVQAPASDAAAHAAKRVYANTLDATGDLDAASAAARKAAAAASQGIQDQVKPNLLASDDTAAQMAAARGRVREGTPTEGVTEPTPATTLPEGTPPSGTSTNAPTPVTTTAPEYTDEEAAALRKERTGGNRADIPPDARTQLRAQGLTEEEINGIVGNLAAKPAAVPGEAEAFNQARLDAIAKLAADRGVAPEALTVQERAQATAAVIKKLANAKPGQEVGDVLAQAKRVERIADASQAFAVPPEQPTLQQALEMTQGKTFTPPSDNPNAIQLALGGQGGQMGIGEARPIPAGEAPPAGPSLNTQRLNRGLTEPAGFAGTGDIIPPPKNPGVNAQGEFGKDFKPGPDYKEAIAHRAYRELLSVVNSPIRIVTYGHEPLFRQGIGFALTHPGAAREALANMVAVARNPEAAAALNEALNAKPWVKAAMDAGWLTEGARPPETFVNNLINKIPGMRNSGESARIYLTTLRKMGYEQEAQRLWQMGVKDPEEYQSLWNTVSDVTGHGLRGQSIAVGGINPVFSPQAMVGRFRGLLDPFLEKGSFNPLAPGARSVALRNLIGIGGMAAGIEGIAKASGLNLKWGLLDTPLGKVEVGPSTIDPTAGYASIIRMGARAFDAAQSGDLSKLKDTATGYLRGQLGPTVDTMVSTFTGQDWQGKDFNLIQRAQSGQLVKDLYEPIAARSIEDAVKANGPIGALIAAPSMGAMGVETNLLQAARDKATARLSNGAVKTYEEAKGQPLLKQQVDKDASVIDAKGSPTQYQQTADQLHKPTIDEVARQEDLFSKGQNGKKLSDVYHDAGIENRKTAEALTEQYGDQFKSIPQSAQQKLLQDYYAIDKKLPDDAATDAGGHDYEATDAARQDFVASLPADQQQFIKEALQASENNKTPLHQEYDKYIADKKAAGYFATHVDPKSGQTVGLSAKERTALDVAHPELDVAAWKFGSVGGNAGSSLNSREAVTQALASPDAKNKEVTFAGLKRPINQSPETLAMWQYSAKPLDWYMNQLPNGQDAVNEAKRLAGSTGDKEYAKPLDQMDSKHRSVVTGNLHQAALAGSPELEAFLYVWGERNTLTTQAASDKAGQLIKQYHLNDVKAPIKKAA